MFFYTTKIILKQFFVYLASNDSNQLLDLLIFQDKSKYET